MVLLSSSPDAFCVWPIYPISRSIASAAMKLSFGARPAGSLFALEVLDRRKPQERSSHRRITNQHEPLACERHEY